MRLRRKPFPRDPDLDLRQAKVITQELYLRWLLEEGPRDLYIAARDDLTRINQKETVKL